MKIVRNVVIGFLAVMGVLFLLILVWPMDDEEDMEETAATTEVTAHSGSLDAQPAQTTQTAQTTQQQGTQTQPQTQTPAPSTAPQQLVTSGESAEAASGTILIYMNGSDLESEAAEATTDIAEMIESGIGENINVIIQTMGTKEWHDFGISAKTSQIYRVHNGRLECLEQDLGQLDCTDAKTLSDFIGYGTAHFPADRYMFLFWDHGGGPVYGFGYDEWQDEGASLTLDEMAEAFGAHPEVSFDIIGMDCCIMASLETCYVLAPYCRYTLLSEDFESGLGWSYNEWMHHFEENPGMSTPLLGKVIIDDIIRSNEREEGGDSATLTLINEAAIPELYKAWLSYAYANESALLGRNYSRLHRAKGRGFFDEIMELWGYDGSNVTLSDYYVSDMMALAESIRSTDATSTDLKAALKACMTYFGHTADSSELTGLAVSLPYGDADYYEQMKEVYSRCGIDADYINWLGRFVDVEGAGFYDADSFASSWGGWASYESEYGCNSAGCGSINQNACYSENCSDDWTYDYEEEIWYLYDGDILYLYDDETDTTFYYDEYEDEIYYYDEDDDEWYLCED